MSMQVHILMQTAQSENETDIIGVYQDIKDARAKMAEEWQSSKDFWDRQDKSHYTEVYIELFTNYAEAYAIDADYEKTGMTWKIETLDVQ